jgi:hypothetical protein
MPSTTPVRLFIAFALLALAGFFAAGATAGAPAAVLIGFLGVFAAGAALVAEIDTESGGARPADRRTPSSPWER